MKLESILSITNESTNVDVVDYNTNEIISRYDGRDSIDTELNDREVVSQYIENNELYIVILAE